MSARLVMMPAPMSVTPSATPAGHAVMCGSKVSVVAASAGPEADSSGGAARTSRDAGARAIGFGTEACRPRRRWLIAPRPTPETAGKRRPSRQQRPEIDDREHHHPDPVDEVPVERDRVDGDPAPGAEVAGEGAEGQDEEHDQ